MIDIYTHPEFGQITVFWEDGLPVSYQSDLLTPDGEVEHLREWMKSVRLDRSLSMSALPEPEAAARPADRKNIPEVPHGS